MSVGVGSGIEIIIQNPNRFREAGARQLRPWLERLAAALASAALSLGVRFVGDREMRRVNRGFRGIDKTTDVLSFPGEPGAESGHLGDIVISVPAARRQAPAARHAVELEIRTLLLHGLLHCLGHDHEKDGGEMERLEKGLRRTWVRRQGAGGRGHG